MATPQSPHHESRDLDLIVAQRVMGLVPCPDWEVTNFGSAGGPALMKKRNHPADRCFPTVTTSSIYGTIGGPRRYSTDIRAAWELVEHLLAYFQPAGFRAEFTQGSGWKVGLRSTRARRWKWARGDKVPEAICRAALAVTHAGSNGREGRN